LVQSQLWLFFHQAVSVPAKGWGMLSPVFVLAFCIQNELAVDAEAGDAEMDSAITNEILEELSLTLQRVESQSAAILELVKDKGIVKEEELAPYMERASAASSVRWRATRVRLERLLAGLEKSEQRSKDREGEKAEEKRNDEGRGEKSEKREQAPKVEGAEDKTEKKTRAEQSSKEDKSKAA
ncbi:MAG TPA: hypothetical protein VGU90_00055, partial [Terriglobales bacterium]|nr:hypothetical protein [Terriglobales bacterium]